MDKPPFEEIPFEELPFEDLAMSDLGIAALESRIRAEGEAGGDSLVIPIITVRW